MFLLIKKIYKMVSVKERKIVLENAISLSTLQGINYILPLIILPYLIRVIGPEKFGLIAFAQAFVQYFMILTDYGFSVLATREISLCRGQKDRLSAIFSSVMTVKIILTIVSFLILFFTVSFIPKFKNDWLVYALSFGAVVGNALFPIWFFMGIEKMEYISRLNILAGIVYLLGIFIFVKSPADYLCIPLFNSLVFLLTGILGLYIVFKKFKVGFVFPGYRQTWQQLKEGWDIFSSIVAINAYTATRVFAVGLLTNNTLTGYYSIAERIANVIQTFPLISFSQAIYPRLSKIFQKNKKKAFNLMYRIQHVTTIGFTISLPVIFLLSPLLIKVICGIEYKEVILALRLLLLSVFFVGANAYKVQFLLVREREDIYAKIHVAAALVGLPLIFILIYLFSYVGAALATVITEAGIFVVTFQIIKNLI
jgi:PST family polysaccharide transporter